MRTTRGTAIVVSTFALALLSARAAIGEEAAKPLREAFRKGIPADCPFARSTEISSIRLTGRQRAYGASDTWYPAWSEDGKCYSPFMDGDGANGDGLLGFSGINGADPMDLTVFAPKTFVHNSVKWGDSNCRYACTILSHGNVLYYGSAYRVSMRVNGLDDYHVLRPFAGFNISTDGGVSWTTRDGALFPEEPYPKIKVGEPHFVDFGRNMRHSPDGKAYLTGHGRDDSNTNRKEGNPAWMWGDAVYLARVTPSVKNINDPTKYEFYAGAGADGKPTWSARFTDIKPLLSWHNRMGGVTVTWHPGMKKYFMCVTDGQTYDGPYNSYFLESGDLTGPWKIIDYWTSFGKQAYFLNFPSRFIGSARADDGWHLWLSFSANFRNSSPDPAGSKYAFCLYEVMLKP